MRILQGLKHLGYCFLNMIIGTLYIIIYGKYDFDKLLNKEVGKSKNHPKSKLTGLNKGYKHCSK